jgi:DNA modification methylase
MCGDSTSIDAVERLMNGETAELCFTSPPYADQREYNGEKELSTEHLATFIRAAYGKTTFFAVNLGYARKDGAVCPYWDDYISEAKSCGLNLLSWNVWDKGNPGAIGNHTAMFGIEHEWIFVFGPAPKELNRTIENDSAGALTHGPLGRNADGSKIPERRREIRSHRQLGTVLRLPPDTVTRIDHPAKFPVGLPEAYIEAMTSLDGGIYEPFGGSGSTLIACEKTKRKCFMMELDPHYVDVIVARWCKYSGKTSIKRNGEPMEWTI